MDFDLPEELAALPRRARRVHRAGDPPARSARTTTSGSSTTVASTPAPTGTAAACRTGSGRSCSGGAAAGRRGRPLPLRLPREYGGQDGTNLGMAVIREHLARKGLGLHNDLQNEHSIVGNHVGLLLMLDYGTAAQKEEWIDDLPEGRRGFAFGITEPAHGSDATYMETHAERDGDEWVINGEKTWNTGIHAAHARPDLRSDERRAGRRRRASPRSSCRPTRPASDRRVPVDVQHADRPRPHQRCPTSGFPTPRSSATRTTACRSCSTSSTRTGSAKPPRAWARPSSASTRPSSTRRAVSPSASRCSTNQAIQFPLVELQTQCEMLRALIHKTAWGMDRDGPFSQSDRVSMCNYCANRLCCEAADRAMQVHGGLGYTRTKPFEHIYRHHRRYRITEGSEEIQMRRVAGYLFGFMRQAAPKGVTEVPGDSRPSHRPKPHRLLGAHAPKGRRADGHRARRENRRSRTRRCGEVPERCRCPPSEAVTPLTRPSTQSFSSSARIRSAIADITWSVKHRGLLDEEEEPVLVDHGEDAVGAGHRSRRPRRPVDQRHLSEDVVGAERPDHPTVGP